jgi:hypothetical protein
MRIKNFIRISFLTIFLFSLNALAITNKVASDNAKGVFAVSSKAATLIQGTKGYELKLTGVSPNVMAFLGKDNPLSSISFTKIADFNANWPEDDKNSTTNDDNADNPILPNAIVILNENNKQISTLLFVDITHPSLSGETLTYNVAHIKDPKGIPYKMQKPMHYKSVILLFTNTEQQKYNTKLQNLIQLDALLKSK